MVVVVVIIVFIVVVIFVVIIHITLAVELNERLEELDKTKRKRKMHR